MSPRAVDIAEHANAMWRRRNTMNSTASPLTIVRQTTSAPNTPTAIMKMPAMPSRVQGDPEAAFIGSASRRPR